MLEIEDLNLLSILYETKSMKETAKALKIKDASVKSKLDQMETKISIKLVSLNADAVIFTNAGLSLAKDAEYIIKYIRSAITNSQIIDMDDKMKLKVGSAIFSPDRILLSSLEGLKDELKNIEIERVHVFSMEETLKHLESHVDILSTYYDDRLLKKYSLSALELKKEKAMIALSNKSELKDLSLLDIEDLYGKRLYIYKKGYLKAFDQIRADIKEYHKSIEVETIDSFDLNLENKIDEEDACLLTFKEMEGCFSDLILKPVLWNYSTQFGILYKKDANDKVKKVINLLKAQN